MRHNFALRSAEYDPDCNCPSKAGIPAWAIAVSVLVVLLVAIAIFLVYKYFPLTHVEIVPQTSSQEKEPPSSKHQRRRGVKSRECMHAPDVINNQKVSASNS